MNYQSKPRKGSERIVQGLFKSQHEALKKIAEERGGVPATDIQREAVGLFLENEEKFRAIAKGMGITTVQAMQMGLDWYSTAILRNSGEISNSEKEDSVFEDTVKAGN